MSSQIPWDVNIVFIHSFILAWKRTWVTIISFPLWFLLKTISIRWLVGTKYALLRFQSTSQYPRLRAVSLFSVVRRAKHETRKWPRAWLMARNGRGTRFARLAASPLPRACIALTKSEEKERLLAVYSIQTRVPLSKTFSRNQILGLIFGFWELVLYSGMRFGSEKWFKIS